MEASIIVTYRCPMHCAMCNIWANPTRREDEFKPELLKKLPELRLVNVTGGEPLVREDLNEIIRILFTRTSRVVISTSGWYEDRIFRLAREFPCLGFRVSIEGLSQVNDELRGRPGGFDRGLRVLLGLRRLGVEDIGFGVTVCDRNTADLLWLYELSRNLRLEFATAVLHNSCYFHKEDNKIVRPDDVCASLNELANRQMSEAHPKSWFRALFNLGLANYVRGKRRMLPCEAGTHNFFVDPYGDLLPCNGMESGVWVSSMGNLHDAESFDAIWNSPRARRVRDQVATCSKFCWMVGSASPVMKRYSRQVFPWVLKNKLKSLGGGRVCEACCPHFDVGQDRRQGSLADAGLEERVIPCASLTR